MATKSKGTNRRKLMRIQAYTIIVLFMLFGAVVGFFLGKLTTSDEVQTITVSETVSVPSYESDSLPETEDVTYFNVPLSHSLQRYIYEICADEEVPITLVIAMIEHESNFNPEAISSTDDYGLMQINDINNPQLEETYRCADMLDPYQNVFCGIKILSSYIQKYEGDYGKALMAYNMGDYGARKAWSNGIESTEYTEAIMELWEEYEEELKNAESVVNE